MMALYDKIIQVKQKTSNDKRYEIFVKNCFQHFGDQIK